MSCCDEGEINFVHRDGSDRSCPPKNHNEVIQLVLFEERKKCTNTVCMMCVHIHVPKVPSVHKKIFTCVHVIHTLLLLLLFTFWLMLQYKI